MTRRLTPLGLAAALAAFAQAGPVRAGEDPAPPGVSAAPARSAPAPYQPDPARPAPVSLELPVGASEEVPRPSPATPSQPGYVISTAQGDTLIVGGYVHTDGRAFVGRGADAYVDQLLLRQVRPVLEGTLRNHFDYRLIPDFAGGKVVVQEAFVDLRFVPWLEVRIGKMKVPVGLERLQNANAVTFAERAFPAALAPNRDVGAEIFGEVGGVLTYAVGVFDGVVDGGIGESDQDSNKEGAARVFLKPFARTGLAPLEGLGLGMSGTWGAPRGTIASPQLPSFVSPGQNAIFSYSAGSTSGTPAGAPAAAADGTHTRWDLQGSYYYGALGMQSELINSTQRVKRGETVVHASNWAWEGTAALVLTGERATYRMVVPDRPLDPATGQWGAVELAARFQLIRFDDSLFVDSAFADATQQVRGANAWGVGANWYLDRALRVMVSYDRTRFFSGASSGGRETDRAPEQVIIGRAQLVF